ncbi:MAG: tRNA pseudouridine synthase A, partial [Clostridia bacterium]|nr:tRNA pseudouridine synthase A [Clostridia bacterium]
MRRIRMIIAYDGTDYVGWQVQPNGIAVQQILGEALFKLTGEKCALHASGRTDSGVHARAQVAHFDTESRIPADKIAFAVNTRLPKDIRVKASFIAPEAEGG